MLRLYMTMQERHGFLCLLEEPFWITQYVSQLHIRAVRTSKCQLSKQAGGQHCNVHLTELQHLSGHPASCAATSGTLFHVEYLWTRLHTHIVWSTLADLASRAPCTEQLHTASHGTYFCEHLTIDSQAVPSQNAVALQSQPSKI